MKKIIKRKCYKSRAEEHRRHTKKNPIETMLNSARYRSKLLNREFSLTVNDIKECPLYCPINGVKLDYLKSKGVKHSASASIDRIDNNNKGYVSGNVRIISLGANVGKRNSLNEGNWNAYRQ